MPHNFPIRLAGAAAILSLLVAIAALPRNTHSGHEELLAMGFGLTPEGEVYKLSPEAQAEILGYLPGRLVRDAGIAQSDAWGFALHYQPADPFNNDVTLIGLHDDVLGDPFLSLRDTFPQIGAIDSATICDTTMLVISARSAQVPGTPFDLYEVVLNDWLDGGPPLLTNLTNNDQFTFSRAATCAPTGGLYFTNGVSFNDGTSVRRPQLFDTVQGAVPLNPAEFANAYCTNLNWLEFSNQLAMTCQRDRPTVSPPDVDNWTLYILDPDGNVEQQIDLGPRRVTSPMPMIEIDPTHLVFVSDGCGPFNAGNPDAELCLLDETSGVITPLTNNTWFDGNPALAGDHLVYYSQPPGDFGWSQCDIDELLQSGTCAVYDGFEDLYWLEFSDLVNSIPLDYELSVPGIVRQ